MGFLLKIAIFAAVVYGAWTTVRRWYGVLGGDATKKTPPPAEREALGGVKCGRPDCPQPA